MTNRRRGPEADGQTVGGFLDSIIAKRQPDGKARGPDHLANRQRIESWLSSLPITEAMAAKEAAFALLLEQDAQRLPFSPQRTEAMFYLDRGMYPHLIKLESDYLASKAGGELEQVLWRACSDLGRAYIVTYERAFSENVERLGSRAALSSLTQILVRMIHYLGWQARLTAYQHADWLPGRWQQLHRMYRKAKAFGVQVHEVPDLSDPARQRKTSAESEYLSLLLMWRLNSGTLSRTEIAQAYYWLRDRPRHLLFVPTSRPGTRLGVDPTQPEGLKPAAHLAPTLERLLFDSTVLAESLTQTQARLEERLQATAGEADARRLRQQIELVRYLATHWVVNGFTERAARIPTDRRVEVVSGWPAITASLKMLLDGAAGGDLAAATRPGAATARTDLAARAEETGARGRNLWIVRDESVSGCRVVSPAGKGGSTRVGEAISLRDPLTDQYDVALVRRWKMAGEDRIEMGLMWLGRNAKPLVLHPSAAGAAHADPHPIHVLGGEPEGGQGELLLALVPSQAVQTTEQLWERAAPRGKFVLRIEAIALSGIDWSWVRMRLVAKQPGVAGQSRPTAAAGEVTEIEIKAPKD